MEIQVLSTLGGQHLLLPRVSPSAFRFGSKIPTWGNHLDLVLQVLGFNGTLWVCPCDNYRPTHTLGLNHDEAFVARTLQMEHWPQETCVGLKNDVYSGVLEINRICEGRPFPPWVRTLSSPKLSFTEWRMKWKSSPMGFKSFECDHSLYHILHCDRIYVCVYIYLPF